LIIKIYSAFWCLRFSIFHNSFQLTTKKRRSTCQSHSNLQSTPQAAKSMQFMYSAPGRRSIISSTSTRYTGTSCQRKNRSWASGVLARRPYSNFSFILNGGIMKTQIQYRLTMKIPGTKLLTTFYFISQTELDHFITLNEIKPFETSIVICLENQKPQ